ncbi:MAG: ABC transporter substrate-binding protein [Chloroflexota bacterium]
MDSGNGSFIRKVPVTRRSFLQVLTMGGGAALLTACQTGPASPPAPSSAAPPQVSQAAPTAAPRAEAPPQPASGQASSDSSAPAGWNELIAGAKQEGEVVIFLGRAASRQVRPVFSEFEKKYGIKATAVIGSGGENADKILAERNTGLYTGDLWMGGSTSMNTRLVPNGVLEPIGPILMLPEVKDQSLWWGGKHLYGDKDQNLIFMFAASPTPYLAYNTQMVNPDEFQSWTDLLDPKWKGKILSRDPTQSGTGVSLMGFYHSPLLGQDFLRRIYLEQDVTLTRDGRQGAEWLALGKFPLYFIPSGSDPREAKDQGLPVAEIVRPMKEGAWLSSGGTGTIGYFSKAAHPNAAKLFVNWWLTKEAQLLVMQQNPEDESLREDISKDAVLPEFRRRSGVQYTHLDSKPEYLGRDGEPNEFMKGVLESKR